MWVLVCLLFGDCLTSLIVLLRSFIGVFSWFLFDVCVAVVFDGCLNVVYCCFVAACFRRLRLFGIVLLIWLFEFTSVLIMLFIVELVLVFCCG